MSFLTDRELKTLLGPPNPIIEDVDLSNLDSVSSQIQACSVDLRIGEVYVKTPKGKIVRPVLPHVLGVGEAANVRTREKFKLTREYGGIAFAPARLTRKGILALDVGHIDPGFRQGSIGLTLINLSQEPYTLQENDTFVTVMLFRLTAQCDKSLADRDDARQPYENAVEDTKRLSADFLGTISKAAADAARKEVKRELGTEGWRRAFFSYFLPIALGFGSAMLTFYLAVQSRLQKVEIITDRVVNEERMIDAEKRLSRVETLLESPGFSRPDSSPGKVGPNRRASTPDSVAHKH